MGETSAETLGRVASTLADRYRVTQLIGQGGMATVYLADDIRHSRTVAVKVMRPELTEGVGSERFLREINTSARLNHPHILPLLDSGRADELLFDVMPFIDGESLRHRLKRDGRLPVDDAIRIVTEIADGLGYAHRAGIIHRDIKPENILLSSGHAVITDFGIARALDQAGDSNLTGTGMVTGTPYYMSPEQWDSAPGIDGRSDQYALGCMAYEMLIGQRPFVAPTNMALMLQHLTSPVPSVRVEREEVPEHVDAAIATAMAKTPTDRFTTSDEFAAALRSSAAFIPTPTALPKPVPAKAWATRTNAIRGGVAALVLAGVAFAGYQIQKDSATAGPMRLVVLPFKNQGPSSEAYFADGVSDEITTRLASVSSLEVISRTSAVQYRETTKTIQQIGEELDVDYLIEGTVRWSGSSSAQNSVKVTCQLIRISDGSVLLPYDTTTALNDVFAIQAGIAQQVTQKLSVVLLQPERRRLATQPTDDLEAYRNYLQGNTAYERSWSRGDVESALAFYQKAVELDQNFALAWAKLGRTHAWMNQLRYDLSDERLRQAKTAADKAVTLDPTLAEAHLALGLYWYWGLGDYDRALVELTRADALEPSNAQVSLQLGNVRRRQGRWNEAITSYRKSADLNPRSHNAWFNLGETLLFVRRYDEAAGPLARVTDLAPNFLEGYLQQARLAISSRGDLQKARSLVRRAEETIPPTAWRTTMLDWMRVVYGDKLGDYVTRLHPGSYGLDSVTYHMVKGRFLLQLGQRDAATVQFDSARVFLEQMRDRQPDQPWTHATLGTAYAGLNRPEDAMRSARHATELLSVQSDALEGPDFVYNLAGVHVMLGNADSAAVYFDRALSIPSWFSLNMLTADPLLRSFVGTPQFQRLQAKFTNTRRAASVVDSSSGVSAGP
ncbi:MAG TPA: protein kinase [Gemmatimonadaceae bacterium]|nr:protein kinase [Gemmatimonadaceae bacterium]